MKNFFRNQFVYVFLALLVVGFGTLTIHWSMVDDGKSAQVADAITTSIESMNFDSFIASVLEPDTGRFRPAYWLYQWITFLVAGPNSFYHHLIHLLVFVSCTYFFYKIISFVSKDSRISLLATLFFVFDPLTLENWYRLGPQEPILIATVCISVIFFWKFRLAGNFKYFLISVLFFIFATLVKETAVAYLGVVATFLFLDYISESNRIYFKKDFLYFLITTLIVICTRFLAFKAYPLIGYASMYRLDSSILTNATSFYKVITDTYGPLLQILTASFIIRFCISVKNSGFLKSIPRFYYQIIALSWFFSFFAIQLPWPYTLGRYLQPSFLGLFFFMAAEIVFDIGVVEKLVKENNEKIKRLDVYWFFSLTKAVIYFILAVVFVRNIILDTSYYIWVKGISDFDNDLVTQIIPLADSGRKLYFNADKEGAPILEIFEELRWHLVYIYGVKDLHFDYLPKLYKPVQNDVVITHNYKQAIPVSDLVSVYGLKESVHKKINISGIVITTPIQIIKNIPLILFSLSAEKSQLNKMYAVANYGYKWQIYER